jgi:hypothetical protein
MKILYIGFFGDLSSTSNGVIKKIVTKIKYLNSNDTTCKLISFSEQIKEVKIYNEHITILPVNQGSSLRWFASIDQIKLSCLGALEYLNQHIHSFDVVIFRYPLASKYFLNILKVHANKIFIEHNTIELDEITVNSRIYRKNIPFSWKPGYFVHYAVVGIFPIWREKIYKEKILRYAKGGICVTNEIGEFLKRIYPKYNYVVASNGYEFEGVEPLKYKEIKNEVKLIMLVGCSSPWHGIERICNSIKQYKGNKKVVVDVFGINSDDTYAKKYAIKSESGELNFLGYLKVSEVKTKLIGYHGGMSTMQLYLKGLNEAASLKTREYLSYGLPVVYGYSDSDIESNKIIKKNCIQFPNNSSLIDFNRVIMTLEDLYKNKNIYNDISSTAKQTINYAVKAKELINNLKNWANKVY